MPRQNIVIAVKSAEITLERWVFYMKDGINITKKIERIDSSLPPSLILRDFGFLFLQIKLSSENKEIT